MKTDRVYRYKVRAYQKVKGKKRAGKISYVVTAKPQTKKSKKKNIKDVSIINLEGLYPGYQTRMPRDIKPWRNIVSKKLVWKSMSFLLPVPIPAPELLPGPYGFLLPYRRFIYR